MSNNFKIPTEAELFTKTLVPIIEKIGLERGTKAFASAAPFLGMLKNLTEMKDKQTAEDAIFVCKHLLDTINSLLEEKNAANESQKISFQSEVQNS